MWKPASTCTTSPVVERPRSDSSHSAQPATPSMEVSSFSALSAATFSQHAAAALDAGEREGAHGAG